MKRYTKEEKDDMCKRYMAGEPTLNISISYNILPQCINKILRGKGIVLNHRLPSLTNEQKEIVLRDYNLGISSEIIAKNIGKSSSSVRRELRKNGINIRPATENKRKTKINENYFEIIDTKHKAYFLGLLYADGSENFYKEEYKEKVQLAFSSPPYFNLEVYNNGENQAYSNNQYIDFINGWWKKTVQNIVKMLKPGGIFALNMIEHLDGFNILEDMSGIMLKNGLKEIDRFQIQLSRNKAFMNANGKHKYEPILIFQKQ